MCNAFGSRTAPSRHKAFGQHASRFAEVCESPLANKTTSCPRATNSSANHEITRSVPPYSLGGMASVKGAICAICIPIISLEFLLGFCRLPLQRLASRADTEADGTRAAIARTY